VQQWSDLPGRAESEVALHFLDRRGHPSSKEGKWDLCSTFKPTASKLRPFFDGNAICSMLRMLGGFR
jgi:hypothetical protein